VSVEGLKLQPAFQVWQGVYQGKTRYSAVVEGTFDRKAWALLQRTQKLVAADAPSRSFRLEVLLNESLDVPTPFELIALGPQGKAETHVLSVVVKNPDSLRKPTLWSFSASLGTAGSLAGEFTSTDSTATLGVWTLPWLHVDAGVLKLTNPDGSG
jgi:hypothetical protein